MAKGIRLQPIVSQKAADKIKAVAEENGETISTIINRLIIGQLANPTTSAVLGVTSTSSKTPITTLRAHLKNAQTKVVAKEQEFEIMRRKCITITPEQLNQYYDLLRDAAQIKHQLGEGDHPDEVMQRRYTRDLYRLEDGFDYETIRYEGDQMTEEGVRQYKELESHINTLKDRLK